MTPFSVNPQRQQTEREPLTLLRVPLPIDVVQVQTTATTVFTATNDFHIEALVASNVTATADFITLHLVPSGGSAGATNLIAYEIAIPAKSNVVLFDRENVGLMQPGMFMQALCGVNDAINIWGHGFNYQGQYSA